jgi:3-methyladenine DNA glycosylase/8-oxoguanine DNA glycosylase
VIFSAPAARGLTHLFPAPEVLARADVAGIGLPKAKAATVAFVSEAESEHPIYSR